MRLRHARSFLDVADLVASEGDDVELSSVSASLTVLAGIAASDAACCRALGRRSRGPDHRAAADLLKTVSPGGAAAANALNRLLGLKDDAHYGLTSVSRARLRVALRQASDLVNFAARLVDR
jgi:hypothetical protein